MARPFRSLARAGLAALTLALAPAAASAGRERSDLRLLSEMDHHVLRDLAAIQSRIAQRRAVAEFARRAGAHSGG